MGTDGATVGRRISIHKDGGTLDFVQESGSRTTAPVLHMSMMH